MAEKENTTGTTTGPTVRRRKRLAPSADSGRISRPLLAAAVVILAVGSYMFWPRGADVPAGIGEQYSLVTADSSHAPAPRSGSVDIEQEQDTLIPERPVAVAAAGATSPSQTIVLESATTGSPSSERPAETDTTPPRNAAPSVRKPASKPVSTIMPRPSGPWAVQLDAFQVEANAHNLVQKLHTQGVEAHVRTASASGGKVIFRVWIGWFGTRQDALTYAAQQKATIGNTYPVHR